MSEIINVRSDNFPSYNIVFNNSFENLLKSIDFVNLDSRKVCVVSDSNVEKIYLKEIIALLNSKSSFVTSFTFAAGEESKTLNTVEDLYSFLIENKFDRHDLLVALGGGVVGDLTGFAAATYLRGIDFIQIPTTLLAQVDSSVGGKTGVDFRRFKNMVGAFYQPRLVYININSLLTLPDSQFTAGMGEVVKYGFIKDSQFLEWLGHNSAKINVKDYETLKYMIWKCCDMKRIIVQNDPTEKGERALLNFGHTIGHAIEKIMNFEFLHGDCVSLGMICALYISYKREYITFDEFSHIRDIFSMFNMPCNLLTTVAARDIVDTTKSDKKMINGQINYVLLQSIGKAYIDKTVTDNEMTASIEYLLNK